MTNRAWLASAVASMVTTALTGGPAPHDPQTFRSTTEIVVVDVLVTKGNVPVPGLVAEDFDVRDGGVRQRVESVMLESMPVDLLIALDVSGSLDGASIANLKTAVRAAIAALRPIDRALLLEYSHDIRLSSNWTTDRTAVDRALESIRAGGWTSFIDATFTALALPESSGHRQLLLLVTDGFDTASWLSAADVLKSAEQSRMTVYGVAPDPVTNRISNYMPTLRRMLMSEPDAYRNLFLPLVVNDTGGELLQAAGKDLGPAFVNILSRFRQRYLLSYTPTGVPRPGWHPIEVRVKDSSLSVTARRGYTRQDAGRLHESSPSSSTSRTTAARSASCARCSSGR